MAEGESGLIRRLRERVEELEMQVEQLKEALRDERAARFPAEWKLTPSQAAVLAILTRRGQVSHRGLHALMYADRTDSGEDISVEVFKVFITRIRQKIGAGDGIVSIHGVGYRLTDDLRARLLPYIKDT